jgi:hypothetical protein
MATKTERRMAPMPNRHDDVDDSYDDLLQRYELLRTNAEEVVRENKSLRNERTSYRSTAGVFLVLLAFVIAARFAIYEFVQDGGVTAGTIGTLSNVLFCGAAIMLLFAWAAAEWEEIGWLAVVKYAFVLVTLLFAVSEVSDGALLQGHFSAKATHPLFAGLVAVAALLMGASPLAVAAVKSIMAFLNDVLGGGR